MNALPVRDASVAVAYIRTSSAEQGKAYGPAAQRAAIDAWAAREGVRVAEVFHEDISGTTPAAERPGLADAMSAALRHGAGVVVVAERSRLAREEYVAYDALRLLRSTGLEVLYADGSNATDESGLLLDGIGHVLAAHERRRIVARLKAGRDAKAAAHGTRARAHGGKLPLGYRRGAGGLVEIDPEAAETVRLIYKLVRDGQSIRKVAAAVGMSSTVVDRIVRREVYKTHELAAPIIRGRDWNATQAALATRRKSGR